MGNTFITSICRREELMDFEDISDATFDFISVAVHSESKTKNMTKTALSTKTRRTPSKRPADLNKIVAVVPVTLDPILSTRSIVGSPGPAATQDGDAMSFNDRLNMLTWDPETTPLPTPLTQQELYVFDEYSCAPTHTPTSARATRSKDGWIRRAVNKYRETKTRRRQRQPQDAEATTPRQCKTMKRSLNMTLWGKRTQRNETKTTKDQPYQLPLMTSMSSVLDEDDEEQRFLYDQDVPMWKVPAAQDDDFLLKTKTTGGAEEPISDTESDDSGSDATTVCQFYSRFDEDATSSFSDDLDGDVSDSEFSDWTRSTSMSSCYFSAAEDDMKSQLDDEDSAILASHAAFCLKLSDYLCLRGDCASYMTIEREVTNSNAWMNETERRALCVILQAYSTFRPKAAFDKEMISAAEECLLVFQGDENAAFSAFAMLAQSKW